MTDGLLPLRDVIRKYDLKAKKNLGQNFILDLNLTRKIARSAGRLENHTIIEIGPGPGGLTRALLMEGAKSVIAIERDHRCLPALSEISDAYPGRLKVIHDDALKLDYAELTDGKAMIVANLPYSIGTALLVKWLETEPWPPWFDRMTLMFQREVALRITASPQSKAYGRLAILAQYRAHADLLFSLPPEAFTPAPKVASALISLEPRDKPEFECDVKALSRLTACAFNQRRKMLRKSLTQLVENPVELLQRARIDPTRRAESLSIEEFCRLSNLIQK